MNILVLGGTKFVGRALVDAALAANHQITIFNRGKSNPNIFKDIETLTGDRDGGLSALKGQKWDIVIDTCGYVPRIVRQSVELLQDSAERYLFISTLSVYDSHLSSAGKISESHPLKIMEDESTEEVNAQTYGALKVLCEKEIEKCFSGRSLQIRPGYIVGPHDPTDRFSYWALRATQGGNALAPNPPGRKMQIVDARDLAAWTIQCCENDRKGFYNAVGPEKDLSMKELLDSCVQVAAEKNLPAANFVWLAEKFLIEHEVGYSSELPLCLPPVNGHSTDRVFDNSKAISNGLKFRPLSETISDTISWVKSQEPKSKLSAGLSPEKESRLLRAWSETA